MRRPLNCALTLVAVSALGWGLIGVAGQAGALRIGPSVAARPAWKLGPPGYSMGAPTAAYARHHFARSARANANPVIDASYTHTPTPGSQPDLPPGGPTMNSLTIYEVFWQPTGHYGSNSGDDTTFQNLLQQFAGDLGGSQFYNIVTQYYDTTNSNTHITSTASFGGAWVDTTNAFPHAGTTSDPLLDGDITAEVHRAVVANGWTEDINHIVAVFTPKGIQECDSAGISDGHCTFPVSPNNHGEFCAYHNHFSDSGTDTLYAYMSFDDQFHGNNQTCVAGQTSNDTDPNRGNYPNSMDADAEVSTLSHELIESVTDPHPNDAWTASDGEIGDKCNFNYAPRNDIGADVYLNGHPYIVQQEYSNAIHTCAIDYNGGNSPAIDGPSISFSKSVDNPTPEVTRSVNYTINLSNGNDSGAATNLTLSDTLPAGFTVTNVSAPSATSQSNTSGSVTVNYDTLAVHQSRAVVITATVPTPAGVTAMNCASLSLQDLLGNALTPITTSPCATTTSQVIPTSLTYNGATTQDFNDAATVSATLLDDTSAPVANEPVSFTLNGSETCSGTTDGTGTASCSITPGEPAGTYLLVASFPGDTTYGASSAAVLFTVTLEETTTTYTGPALVANGMPATLSGRLLEDGVTPIAGRTLTLTLGTGGTAQSCTGVTDATGSASCTIGTVAQPLGPGVASATFAGDPFYLPSSGTGTDLLFQYTQGGSFVLGDATVGPIGSAIGKSVTFWADTWPQLNTLSGGPAPASFKGFEDSPALPVAGVPWSTNPGNSVPPPATVPSYTAMIVASHVTKSGSVISGDDLHVVIVRVNPGYGPQPSTHGTGTIVAVLS